VDVGERRIAGGSDVEFRRSSEWDSDAAGKLSSGVSGNGLGGNFSAEDVATRD